MTIIGYKLYIDNEEYKIYENYIIGDYLENYFCYNNTSLVLVPEKMYHYINDKFKRYMTPLEEFNFNSIWYFDEGEEIY